MVFIAARHDATATCTPQYKQTRFSKWNKGKKKQNKTILDSNSNITKSMTHHNQTKELTIWFLNLPLDESIDNKGTKFKSKIPWSTAKRPKTPRKTQEDHLEDGKPQKQANGTKSGKAKQNDTEELRRAQKGKKSLKSTQKLKRARKTQNEHKSSKSTLPLKSIPHNNLNASSPP
jgi:hypothetical protein